MEPKPDPTEEPSVPQRPAWFPPEPERFLADADDPDEERIEEPFAPHPEEDDPWSRPAAAPNPQRARRRWLLLGHWLVVLAGLAALLWAGLKIEEGLLVQTNADAAKSDQASNMRLAGETREVRAAAGWDDGASRALRDWLPSRTDGVINPLWPWIASFLPEAAQPQSAEFFAAGKRLNVTLTLGFLALLGIFLGLRWSSLALLNFLGLIALGCFLPRAPWFQPEPLSYALLLLGWMLGISLLSRNSLAGYASFGLLVALAWLAKANGQLLLAAFVLATFWRWLVATLGYRRQRGWSRRDAMIGLSLMAAVVVAVTAPRFAYAKERYGSGTFSYPAAWMWFDQFPEGYDWMVRHSEATARGEAPPAPPHPGAKAWLEHHGPASFGHRLAGGTWQRLEEMLAPRPTKWKKGKPAEPWRNLLDHRGRWLGASALGLLALGLWHTRLRRDHPGEPDRARRPAPDLSTTALFVVGTVGLFLGSLGWYWPIAHFAERFTLILFAMIAYLLFWGGEMLRRHRPRHGSRAWLAGYTALQLLLLALLVRQFALLLRFPEFQ